MKTKQTPAVGIALIILHADRVLLGRRMKPPMAGSWQLPGGWLRYGETTEQAVQRKVVEFPGMQCTVASFKTITNNHFEDGLHSVSLYYQLRCVNADIVNLNANQHCSDWFWADWYDLPDPLFLPLSLLKRSGYQPLIPE